MGFLNNYVLTTEQNFASVFSYKSFLKINVAISTELPGGKLNLQRITEQKGFGQRKMPE